MANIVSTYKRPILTTAIIAQAYAAGAIDIQTARELRLLLKEERLLTQAHGKTDKFAEFMAEEAEEETAQTNGNAKHS